MPHPLLSSSAPAVAIDRFYPADPTARDLHPLPPNRWPVFELFGPRGADGDGHLPAESVRREVNHHRTASSWPKEPPQGRQGVHSFRESRIHGFEIILRSSVAEEKNLGNAVRRGKSLSFRFPIPLRPSKLFDFSKIGASERCTENSLLTYLPRQNSLQVHVRPRKLSPSPGNLTDCPRDSTCLDKVFHG